MILTLQRQGEFRVGQCGDDTTQCGMRGTRTLHYDVSIRSTERQLNENGFIVDQLEIQRYFDTRYQVVPRFLSCEEIACEATKGLRKLVGPRRCNSIKVTIAPGPNAGLTAEWSAKLQTKSR